MTTTATEPMPTPNTDPAIVEGQQVRHEFTMLAQGLRMNTGLSDLQVAEQITTAWIAANDRLAALFADLQDRRRARLAALEQTVPVGPAIPADASPADAAVLQQAFRAALTQARAAVPARPESAANLRVDRTSLDAMLTDAETFDDDTLRRAVLTAALENGHLALVRSWTDKMGLSDQLDELAELQAAVAGRGMSGLWDGNVFTPIPKPPETINLPRLQEAAQAEIEARVRDNRRGGVPVAPLGAGMGL